MKNLRKTAIDQGFKFVQHNDCGPQHLEGGETLNPQEVADREFEKGHCAEELALMKQLVAQREGQGYELYDAEHCYEDGDLTVFANGGLNKYHAGIDGAAGWWECIDAGVMPGDVCAAPVDTVVETVPFVEPVVDTVPYVPHDPTVPTDVPVYYEETPVINHEPPVFVEEPVDVVDEVCEDAEDFFKKGFNVGYDNVARVQPNKPGGREGYDYVYEDVTIDGITQKMYIIPTSDIAGMKISYNDNQSLGLGSFVDGPDGRFTLTAQCGTLQTTIPELWGNEDVAGDGDGGGDGHGGGGKGGGQGGTGGGSDRA